MAGFVASGGAEAAENPITNDPFFPAIDPAHFRATTRQDKTVTSDRLITALVDAITAVNRELASWQAERAAEGYAGINLIPQQQINATGVLTHHYQRAVYALAKAELLERYRDFDATRSGAEREEENPAPDDIYRRDARWAIASILGRARTVVELI